MRQVQGLNGGRYVMPLACLSIKRLHAFLADWHLRLAYDHKHASHEHQLC